MRVLIETHHPSDIHFWKYIVCALINNGDDVLLLSRDRDVMRKLLEAYNWIPSKIISSLATDNRFPWREFLLRQSRVFSHILTFKPDVVTSLMGSYAQTAWLLRKPNIIFTDSEFEHFNHRIAHPFATQVYTPACFWKNLGPKQRRYNGYHESAFLHPKYFRPRQEVLELLGGVHPKKYVICRLSAWNTLHDIGEAGIGDSLHDFIAHIAARFRVFIVPEEDKLDPVLEKYRYKTAPDFYHDAIAFARLVITEGASTASEAACLGVPAVYVNSTRRGYLDDQEKRYQLVFNFQEIKPALAKTLELLEPTVDLDHFRQQSFKMHEEHIDVVEFVVETLHKAARRKLP